MQITQNSNDAKWKAQSSIYKKSKDFVRFHNLCKKPIWYSDQRKCNRISVKHFKIDSEPHITTPK